VLPSLAMNTFLWKHRNKHLGKNKNANVCTSDIKKERKQTREKNKTNTSKYMT
jgi:hypothetical protein